MRAFRPSSICGIIFAGLLCSGCFATARQLQEVQTDVTKKGAWNEERLSRMEADVEALRAENETVRQRLDSVSDQISTLGEEVSRRLDEVGKSSRSTSSSGDSGQDRDQEELLNKMNVILDELVKENSRLSDRIKKLESSAVAFGKVHKVKKGETLASIARKYKVSVEAIQDANGISGSKSIEVGQEILIPGS